jgi:hypothetical protein
MAGLGTHAYIPAQHELADIDELAVGQLGLALRDPETISSLTDIGPLLLNVKRKSIIPCGIETPDTLVSIFASQGCSTIFLLYRMNMGLVGQTESSE